MKQKGNIRKYYYYAFPMQAVLVTCNTREGKTNVITIAWHTPISTDPPLYGISIAPGRYSHQLIEQSKEFVVNFVPFELVDMVHFCGKHTGRKTDKVKEMNFTLKPSHAVTTPYIDECYAHLECTVQEQLSIGDHTFFIGKVENVIADDSAFIDACLDNKKINPVYYIGSNMYTTIRATKKEF